MLQYLNMANRKIISLASIFVFVLSILLLYYYRYQFNSSITKNISDTIAEKNTYINNSKEFSLHIPNKLKRVELTAEENSNINMTNAYYNSFCKKVDCSEIEAFGLFPEDKSKDNNINLSLFYTKMTPEEFIEKFSGTSRYENEIKKTTPQKCDFEKKINIYEYCTYTNKSNLEFTHLYISHENGQFFGVHYYIYYNKKTQKNLIIRLHAHEKYAGNSPYLDDYRETILSVKFL